MELLGVRVELPANTPVVMLREQDAARPRVLPILIGGPEASAIHSAMEGIVPPRPLTHDLAVTVIQSLGATLEKVVITEVREHTFYAQLHLRTASGELVVSSRPSDAIALAVRATAPIFAEETLLDEAAIEVPDDDEEEGDEEAILDEFRDFLDDVNPEDFAS
jgi:bifunctional DNase/RNase